MKSALGKTGLVVTSLGFGAAEISGPPLSSTMEYQDVDRLLNRVLDAGINFIDTSIDYGLSEYLIGRILHKRRAEFYLATKCGCIPGDPERRHLHTAANIRAGVESSLRLLQTDYLDVVQFHLSVEMHDLEIDGALEELLRLKAKGKIRFVGMSGTLPLLREQFASGVFDTFQVPYSALERDHESVITELAQAGHGVIVRGGVSRGGPTDWQGRVNFRVSSDEAKSRWEEAAIDDLLDGMDRMEFMLRFTLSHPDIHTAVVGTGNLEHLEANLKAAQKGPLPEDLVQAAKARLAGAGSRPTSVKLSSLLS